MVQRMLLVSSSLSPAPAVKPGAAVTLPGAGDEFTACWFCHRSVARSFRCS
ncbi:hypothetical protein PF005_g7097 [Phytophthora fragariae]|uniref:Uncharacterized protein n=1 Tax=Phytophthora fragariae TaxID=53985 RepID=A0A6A3SRU4_9STRA|nr:hypothetical protein PF003_g29992 [Phytophthora fragariae]KAE8941413.1 hypothetical protein PF009_g8805 [Phytophthora fragariae]KAE9017360.1 hypothetical protein PF011_g6732 [Phytophthora fragariae]KAE9122191.1 hypothetical protein PF007_g7544 [Phytophthora fragariae]KAE9123103.1 hypothetical protein PF010_g6525 [Phytophthora fragariae]